MSLVRLLFVNLSATAAGIYIAEFRIHMKTRCLIVYTFHYETQTSKKKVGSKNGTEGYQAENYASCVLLYTMYLFRWIRDSNSGDFSQIHLETAKKRS